MMTCRAALVQPRQRFLMDSNNHGYEEYDSHRRNDDVEHDRPRESRRPRQRHADPQNTQVSVLGVLSLVLGSGGLSISVIPCIGVLGMIGGGLGLILGLLGMAESKSSNGRVGMGVPTAGTFVSLTGLLIGAAWFLLMAGAFRNNPNIPGDDEAKVEAPALTLPAIDLDREYDQNELAADSKYLNKLIELNGRVKRVNDETTPGKVTVELVGLPDSFVNCRFPLIDKARLEAMEIGQEIVVRGRCRGKIGDRVALDDCTRVIGEKELEADSAPVRVLAAVLASEYAEDVMQADEKYRGKLVDVTGTLGKVIRGKPGKVSVQVDDDDGVALLTCAFTADAAKPFALLKPGQRVTIRGRCMGHADAVLTFTGCSLVK
ncbi:MAG: hypothetical protein C0467_03995 [Planctomycetaceae bacterium]|nr:hypothetical protein [Planctomycetaceae bacterium]